ncbi:hypothetical protein ACS0TY_022601 [Phlomoides rotata]
MPMLRSLDVSGNVLEGEISSGIEGLYNLRVINLRNNGFSGVVPGGIGSGLLLRSVDLSRNLFFGALPISMQKLLLCNDLNLGRNVVFCVVLIKCCMCVCKLVNVFIFSIELIRKRLAVSEPDQQQPVVEARVEGEQESEGAAEAEDEEDEDGEEDEDEEQEECVIPTPPLLIGFQDHGCERDVLKCHTHLAKLLAWKFDDEEDIQQFCYILNQCNLAHISYASYKNPNKNLIIAFVERWHPEMNSFHFPFGEMTISLYDVHSISGLSVVGEPVRSVHKDKVLGVVDVMNFWGCTRVFVKLAWLRETFRPLMSSDDPDQVLYTARAYMLYIFGTTLFTNKSGTRVKTSWLQYMEDMTEVGIKIQSEADWWLSHVGGGVDIRTPSLFNTTTTKSGLYLSSTTVYAVNWNPYRRDYYPFQEVSFFYGCIVYGNVVEPYMPDRFLKQFSYVQTIPENPLISRVKRRGGNSKRTKHFWGAFSDYFQMWDTHLLIDERLGEQCSHPCYADG